MGGFLHGLQKVAKTAWNISDRGMQYHQQQERDKAAAQAFEAKDNEFIKLASETPGVHVLTNGMYNDPIQGWQQADKSRTMTHVSPITKEKVQILLPTPAEKQLAEFKLNEAGQKLNEPLVERTQQQVARGEGLNAAARTTATTNVQTDVDTANRQRVGIPYSQIPQELQRYFNPSGGPYTQKEILEAGQTANALEPNHVPPPPPPEPKYADHTAADGTVTRVIQHADGRIETKDLGKIGAPQKPAAGDNLTAGQILADARARENMNRAARNDASMAARYYLDRVERTDEEEQKLYKENEGLKEQWDQLNVLRTAKKLDSAGQVEMRGLEAKIAANMGLAERKMRQKQQYEAARRAAERQAAGGSADEPPAAEPTPTKGKLPPFQNGAGGAAPVVRWERGADGIPHPVPQGR